MVYPENRYHDLVICNRRIFPVSGFSSVSSFSELISSVAVNNVVHTFLCIYVQVPGFKFLPPDIKFNR